MLRGHFVFCLLTVFIFAGCSAASRSQKAPRTAGTPQSVLQSPDGPRDVFERSSAYLDYYLGLGIQVRDLERGLLVSEWSRESPLERYQITLRFSPNEQGTLISSHIRAEELVGQRWTDLPSQGDRESQFLAGLQDFLRKK
jgi:hypothetical protein